MVAGWMIITLHNIFELSILLQGVGEMSQDVAEMSQDGANRCTERVSVRIGANRMWCTRESVRTERVSARIGAYPLRNV